MSRSSFFRCFFPHMAFLPVQLPALEITLYYSPTAAHPALQSSRHCLLNFEVPSHSLTHSVTPINLPPHCPLRVFRHACQTASLLSELDERTYDHLNKHSHSMASLSAQPLGTVPFVWCAHIPRLQCLQMFLSPYAQT